MQNNLKQSANQFFQLEDGARLRYKTWRPAKSQVTLPRIILLLGRGSIIEEVEHFVTKILAEGYEVWCFDWRGQGLSTRILGQKGYIDSYETYIDDLEQFLNFITLNQSDSSPFVMVAHSMGSHIGLRYCAQHPGRIGAALLIAPMLDIYKGHFPRNIVVNFFKLLCMCGLSKHYFINNKNHNPALAPFLNNKLTRNLQVYNEMRQILINYPELVLGGVTYGWIYATLKSVQILFQPDYLKKITIPVHIIEAGNERIVNNISLNRICNTMDQCSFEVIPEASHQLMSELPEVQNRILSVLNELVESIFYMVPNYSFQEKEYSTYRFTDSIKRIVKKFLWNDAHF